MLISQVLDAKWASFIFVFGPVVGYKSVPSQTQSEYEIYNVAIIQQGGLLTNAESKKKSVFIMKEHKSGIDFLQNASYGGLVDRGVHPMENSGKVSSISFGRKQLAIDDDCIFTLQGVTFGLEVCLDHACKRLVSIGQSSPEKIAKVQIQLVPSCGMTIMPEGQLCNHIHRKIE